MENKFTNRQEEIIIAATKRIDESGIQELTIKNLAADIGLSEAGLYRHFKSKNDILLGVLNYFIFKMNNRLNGIMSEEYDSSSALLQALFVSQLNAFEENPSIISVVFSEGIFQFNKQLTARVSDMMDVMQSKIELIIQNGQENNEFNKLVGVKSTTTIIMGSMRLIVLKWKLSGHQSNLIKDGNKVLTGLLKMLSK